MLKRNRRKKKGSEQSRYVLCYRFDNETFDTDKPTFIDGAVTFFLGGIESMRSEAGHPRGEGLGLCDLEAKS